MSGTEQTNRDATKCAFLARSRYGSPFLARVPGRPGESGYNPSAEKLMNLLLLVPKTEAATIKRIQVTLDTATEETWGQRRPASLRVPMTDGDERKSDGTYVHPGDEFRGQMLVRVRAREDRMPVVMKGPAGQQVQAYPRDYQPGYWLIVVCRAFTYNRSGNTGVSLGCNAVNITAEDAVFTSDEPISDLDAALSGASLPASALPITSGPKEPPTANSDPAAQFA
jgi:hypothetical protein